MAIIPTISTHWVVWNQGGRENFKTYFLELHTIQILCFDGMQIIECTFLRTDIFTCIYLVAIKLMEHIQQISGRIFVTVICARLLVLAGTGNGGRIKNNITVLEYHKINHGTILQTGITCKKTPCYIRQSVWRYYWKWKDILKLCEKFLKSPAGKK